MDKNSRVKARDLVLMLGLPIITVGLIIASGYLLSDSFASHQTGQSVKKAAQGIPTSTPRATQTGPAPGFAPASDLAVAFPTPTPPAGLTVAPGPTPTQTPISTVTLAPPATPEKRSVVAANPPSNVSSVSTPPSAKAAGATAVASAISAQVVDKAAFPEDARQAAGKKDRDEEDEDEDEDGEKDKDDEDEDDDDDDDEDKGKKKGKKK